MSKKAILVDIHNTSLDENGKINQNLYDMIKTISKDYLILLITARYYANIEAFHTDIKSIANIAKATFYNSNTNYKKDSEIKEYIYKEQIAGLYDVKLVIDNSKNCCKMFKQNGIDTLRYKNKGI